MSIAEAQNEIDKSIENAQRQDTLTSNMVKLTRTLTQDSSNMKVIAILTALFLPGTFMAVRSPPPSYFALTKPSVRSCSIRQCSNGQTS